MREAYDTTLVAASAASTNPQHVLAADALDPIQKDRRARINRRAEQFMRCPRIRHLVGTRPFPDAVSEDSLS